MTYTAQQRAALRSNRAARKLVERFPVGTRVKSGGLYGPPTEARGTVERLVPQTNAQGGYLVVRWDNGDLVVRWDNGSVGRHSPGSLEEEA